MQFKDGITPRHSPLPSTQEHAAKSYRVPAEAPCWGERTDAQSCREKGLPRAHTSSKVKSNKPTGLAASTRSSSGFPGRSGGCWRWVWLSGVPGRLVRLVCGWCGCPGARGSRRFPAGLLKLQRGACGERRPLRPSAADGTQGLCSTAWPRAGKGHHHGRSCWHALAEVDACTSWHHRAGGFLRAGSLVRSGR